MVGETTIIRQATKTQKTPQILHTAAKTIYKISSLLEIKHSPLSNSSGICQGGMQKRIALNSCEQQLAVQLINQLINQSNNQPIKY